MVSRHIRALNHPLHGYVVCLLCFLMGPIAEAGSVGSPDVRFYSLDEIGKVSTGVRLKFDLMGLIAVTQNGSHAVSNNRVWTKKPYSSQSLVGTESRLTLPCLRKDHHSLKFQLADHSPVAPAISIASNIAPPWFRTAYAYLAYCMGALAIICLVISWVLHRTRNPNRLLAKLLQERNEETHNAATLAERTRIEGEIHDSLQQGLTGLMLHLDATLKLPSISKELHSRLITAQKMVSLTQQELQHTVENMESPLLENSDLGNALRKTADSLEAGSAQIGISVTGDVRTIPSPKTHHLLRIAQEAMTNAVRYGAAKTITIELAHLTDSISLTIADDGQGFDPDEVLKQDARFGLRGMRNRARIISGELSVNSQPGQGTSVRVRVPFSEDTLPINNEYVL